MHLEKEMSGSVQGGLLNHSQCIINKLGQKVHSRPIVQGLLQEMNHTGRHNVRQVHTTCLQRYDEGMSQVSNGRGSIAEE